MLVAVKHLTGWPIAGPARNATAETVIEIIKKEIIYNFLRSSAVISYNVSWFLA